MNNRYRLARIVSIILLIANGISACFGGYMLITDPTGRKIQLSQGLLHTSPFSSYLVPGILLLVVLGLGSLVVAILAILKVRGYAVLVAMIGVALIIWIIVQMLMLQMVVALQFVFGGAGIVLAILGLAQWESRPFNAGF